MSHVVFTMTCLKSYLLSDRQLLFNLLWSGWWQCPGYTHTCTRAQTRTCSQMQPVHLTAGVVFFKKWSVGLLCFFFFILRNKNRDTCCESPQCVMMLSQRGRRPVLAVMWSHKRQIAFMTSTVLPTARAADRSIREGIYVTDRLQRGDSCPNDRQHCH